MQASKQTDDQIIAALKHNEASRNEALRYVFETLNWKSTVMGFIVQNGGDETEAKEIAVSTLAIFDRNIRNELFKGNSSLKTYFLSIAKRQWWKQQKRKKTFDEFDPQKHDQPEPHVEDYILQQEKMAFLQRATSVLGEKCKKLFRLKELDYTGEEIAVEMELKNAAMVKKALYRCRQNFKKYLDEHPEWKERLY